MTTHSALDPVTRHQNVLKQRYAEFVGNLSAVPPKPCNLQVGQRVTFTNEYGVSFPGRTVIGFANDDSFYGRFVHLDSDCYWMPKQPGSLTPESD